MSAVDPVTPNPTTPPPRAKAGDRVIERIQNELSSHREHTAGELASMERKLQDLLAERGREDAGFRESIQATLDEVKQFISDQKAAAAKQDDVGNNKGTIVVPPSDVKPVTPPPEVVEGVEGEQKPKKTWKDWF